MGLIRCIECGKFVSDRVGTCFHCGKDLPIHKEQEDMFKCYICEHYSEKTVDEVIDICCNKDANPKEILCKNCGANIGATAMILKYHVCIQTLDEQIKDFQEYLNQEMTILLQTTCVVEPQAYKITNKWIIMLARLVDPDMYNALSLWEQDSEIGRKYIKKIDSSYSFWRYIDTLVNYAYSELEHNAHGKDIYYYNKYSFKSKLESYLNHFKKLHNYLIERYKRDKCSLEEMKKIVQYILEISLDFQDKILDYGEKICMGFDIYVDMMKKKLINKD